MFSQINMRTKSQYIASIQTIIIQSKKVYKDDIKFKTQDRKKRRKHRKMKKWFSKKMDIKCTLMYACLNKIITASR